MEWRIAFYANDSGGSPVSAFLSSLSVKERAKCYAYMALLEQYGSRLTGQYVKHLEGDLWELRPEFGGVEMRLFYFMWVDNMIVIVHALKKKTQRTRRQDIAIAGKRIGEIKDGKIGLVQVSLD